METSRANMLQGSSCHVGIKVARVASGRKATSSVSKRAFIPAGRIGMRNAKLLPKASFKASLLGVRVSHELDELEAKTELKLSFTLPHRVDFGVIIKLVGSTPELGEWNVHEAPAFEWTEGNVWRLTLEDPPQEECEYKLVAFNTFNGCVYWEDRDNRILKVGVSKMKIKLSWNEWTEASMEEEVEVATIVEAHDAVAAPTEDVETSAGVTEMNGEVSEINGSGLETEVAGLDNNTTTTDSEPNGADPTSNGKADAEVDDTSAKVINGAAPVDDHKILEGVDDAEVDGVIAKVNGAAPVADEGVDVAEVDDGASSAKVINGAPAGADVDASTLEGSAEAACEEEEESTVDVEGAIDEESGLSVSEAAAAAASTTDDGKMSSRTGASEDDDEYSSVVEANERISGDAVDAEGQPEGGDDDEGDDVVNDEALEQTTDAEYLAGEEMIDEDVKDVVDAQQQTNENIGGDALEIGSRGEDVGVECDGAAVLETEDIDLEAVAMDAAVDDDRKNENDGVVEESTPLDATSEATGEMSQEDPTITKLGMEGKQEEENQEETVIEMTKTENDDDGDDVIVDKIEEDVVVSDKDVTDAHQGMDDGKLAEDEGDKVEDDEGNPVGGLEKSKTDDDGSILFTSELLSQDLSPELAASYDSLLKQNKPAGEEGSTEVQQLNGSDAEEASSTGDGSSSSASVDATSNGESSEASPDGVEKSAESRSSALNPALTVAALGLGTAVLGAVGLELSEAVLGGSLLLVGSAAVFNRDETNRRKKREAREAAAAAEDGAPIEVSSSVEEQVPLDLPLKDGDEEKSTNEEDTDEDVSAVIQKANTPGVALAAMLMLPLVAGSKVLDTVDKVGNETANGKASDASAKKETEKQTQE